MCPAETRSQIYVSSGIAVSLKVELSTAKRGISEEFDKTPGLTLARDKLRELFSRNDDDRLLSSSGDVLRPLSARSAKKLAESGLSVL